MKHITDILGYNATIFISTACLHGAAHQRTLVIDSASARLRATSSVTGLRFAAATAMGLRVAPGDAT